MILVAMSNARETSDAQLLGVLRREGTLGISELTQAMGVTSTAVRQRLTRLMKQGLVERVVRPRGRGRPSHGYRITERARRGGGQNFADLAVVLWNELRSVKSAEVRRGLLKRIAERLGESYAAQIDGQTTAERMQSLGRLFDERQLGLRVEPNGGLPVLVVDDCPYPDLAAVDRSVCAMENLLFEKLLGERLKLSACRLDGHACCQFETN